MIKKLYYYGPSKTLGEDPPLMIHVNSHIIVVYYVCIYAYLIIVGTNSVGRIIGKER